MNFFLTRDKNIRIGDLGVAKVLAHTAAFAHTMIGTPYYLSPELCEEKPYNVKSDIWALGCVLYEMCALRHPFEATNQGALILKILRSKYPPLSDDCSSDTRELLGAMLIKDYHKRPTVTSILLRENVKTFAVVLNIDIPANSVLRDNLPYSQPISFRSMSPASRTRINASSKGRLIKPNGPLIPKNKTIENRSYEPMVKPSLFILQMTEFIALVKPQVDLGMHCKKTFNMLNKPTQNLRSFEADTSFEIKEEISVENSELSQSPKSILYESEGELPVFTSQCGGIPVIECSDTFPAIKVYQPAKKLPSMDDSYDEFYEEEEDEEIYEEISDEEVDHNVRYLEKRHQELNKVFQSKKDQIVKRIGLTFYDIYEYFKYKVQSDIEDEDQEEIDLFISQTSDNVMYEMYQYMYLEIEIDNIEEELKSAKLKY